MLKFKSLLSNAQDCVKISEGELVTHSVLCGRVRNSDKAGAGIRLSCESDDGFFPPHQKGKKMPLIK